MHSNGLQMQMNYSWSKATGIMGPTPGYSEQQIGNLGKPGSGGIDYANLENNHGYLLWDITHRFAGVVSYELPTGKGKALDPGNKVLRALIGEWQVGSVITLQSGSHSALSCSNTVTTLHRIHNETIELPKNYRLVYGIRRLLCRAARVNQPTSITT